MKPFSIETTEPADGSSQVVEVRVSGYLDAHTVVSFERTMEDLLGRQYHKFILDLADLNYISSAGIGALMVLLQQLRRRQGDMVLLAPSPKVFKVLDLLGFTRVFQIADDRAGALKALGS